MPCESLIEREFAYQHPQFDSGAIKAQRRLPQIQGRRRTWFCGSYFGYGFHEDALMSGLSVARELGVKAPWLGGRGTYEVLSSDCASPAPVVGPEPVRQETAA